MVKIQKLTITTADKNAEEQELSFIVGGNTNDTPALEDSLAVYSKNKQNLPI